MARAITSIDVTGIAPAIVQGVGPEIRRVDPRKLLVDDVYQRDVGKAGLKLIAKIISTFSWAKYKLPTVVETNDGLIVIDGQHTAIACASIPSLCEIPVAVVAVASTEEQAIAFLGINKDRLNVGHVQLHHAAAASGDESARSVNEVCAACGVTVLRSPRAPKTYNEGETIAVSNIQDLIRQRGRDHASKVLTICRKARLAPISQAYVKAVSAILLDEEKMAILDEETLLAVVQKTRGSIEKEAKTWAAEHDVPFFKALASVLFKAAKSHVHPTMNRQQHRLSSP